MTEVRHQPRPDEVVFTVALQQTDPCDYHDRFDLPRGSKVFAEELVGHYHGGLLSTGHRWVFRRESCKLHNLPEAIKNWPENGFLMRARSLSSAGPRGLHDFIDEPSTLFVLDVDGMPLPDDPEEGIDVIADPQRAAAWVIEQIGLDCDVVVNLSSNCGISKSDPTESVPNEFRGHLLLRTTEPLTSVQAHAVIRFIKARFEAKHGYDPMLDAAFYTLNSTLTMRPPVFLDGLADPYAARGRCWRHRGAARAWALQGVPLPPPAPPAALPVPAPRPQRRVTGAWVSALDQIKEKGDVRRLTMSAVKQAWQEYGQDPSKAEIEEVAEAVWKHSQEKGLVRKSKAEVFANVRGFFKAFGDRGISPRLRYVPIQEEAEYVSLSNAREDKRDAARRVLSQKTRQTGLRRAESLLLRASAGTGKSTIVLEESILALVEEMRKDERYAILSGMPTNDEAARRWIPYAVPNHTLTAQVEKDFWAAKDRVRSSLAADPQGLRLLDEVQVHVLRGRKSERPGGGLMCLEPDLVDVISGQNLPQMSFCREACPSRHKCPYLQHLEKVRIGSPELMERGIIAMPMEHLTRSPVAGMSANYLAAVVDEDFPAKMLRDSKFKLSNIKMEDKHVLLPDENSSDEFNKVGLELLRLFFAEFHDAAVKGQRLKPFLKAIRWPGQEGPLTAAQLDWMIGRIRDSDAAAEPDVTEVPEDLKNTAEREDFKKRIGSAGTMKTQYRLLALIRREWSMERDDFQFAQYYEAADEIKLRVSSRSEFRMRRDTPVVVMDATADLKLISDVFGNRRLTILERKVEPHASVTFLHGYDATKTRMVQKVNKNGRREEHPTPHALELLHKLDEWCAQRPDETIIVATYKALAEWWRKHAVSQNVILYHFGAARGLNDGINADALWIVGRPATPTGEFYTTGRAHEQANPEVYYRSEPLSSHVENVWLDCDGAFEMNGRRMCLQVKARRVNGDVYDVGRRYHDVGVTGELEQIIGRGRAVLRTPENPLKVYFLALEAVRGAPVTSVQPISAVLDLGRKRQVGSRLLRLMEQGERDQVVVLNEAELVKNGWDAKSAREIIDKVGVLYERDRLSELEVAGVVPITGRVDTGWRRPCGQKLRKPCRVVSWIPLEEVSAKLVEMGWVSP